MQLQKVALVRIIAVMLLIAISAGLGARAASAQEGTPTATSRPPGTERKDARGIEQVWVSAGCFMQGTVDPDGFAGLKTPSWIGVIKRQYEMPAHEVCLSRGYWIDKFEVTWAAFSAFVADDSYTTQAYWSADGWAWKEANKAFGFPLKCTTDNKPDMPQVCISWYEAQAYAAWRGGQLPTESQWEFAARGPESLIFPWGNEFDPTRLNMVDAIGLTPVGSFPDGASWVGAHDMAGNAMEWVSDWLGTDYYKQKVKDDPTGPETGTRKVEKGGWWGAPPYVARSAYRHFEDPPSYRDQHIGVRILSAE